MASLVSLSRARALPLLNLRKKRDCSQSKSNSQPFLSRHATLLLLRDETKTAALIIANYVVPLSLRKRNEVKYSK